MRGELITYFGVYGPCGMHLPNIHGVDTVVGKVSFSGSMSISRSLKVPSTRSFARKSGGSSKVGCFAPSVGLPFVVIWL
jgi:hypothetical protein